VFAEFAKHEVLMMLLREDAWAGLTMAVRTMQLGTLAGDPPPPPTPPPSFPGHLQEQTCAVAEFQILETRQL